MALPAGSIVRAGDVVARLHNPELELDLAAKEGLVHEHELKVDQLRTLEATLPAAARQLPTAQAELEAAQASLREGRAMVDLLAIRSPVAGRVWLPPKRAPSHHDQDALQPWRGWALDSQNLGAWIEPGAPLAVVAEGDGWIAWAGVPQADVPAVEVDQ